MHDDPPLPPPSTTDRAIDADDPPETWPLCPYCLRPDDECRCGYVWNERGERVAVSGETNPPRRA